METTDYCAILGYQCTLTLYITTIIALATMGICAMWEG